MISTTSLTVPVLQQLENCYKTVTLAIDPWLVYASIKLAISAVGWTLSVYLLMELPYDPLVLELVFALTIIMYNRDRLANYSKPDDRVNAKQRSEWISAHLDQLKVLVLMATVVTLSLLVLRPAALIPILPSLGFTLNYIVRFLPGRRSPKQIPGFKAFYVAFFWVVLTVGIPLSVAGGPWNSRAALIASTLFCFIVALINLKDLNDIEGDRLVGTMTLPVLWGKRRAQLFSMLLIILGGCISVWLGSIGFLSFAIYGTIAVVIYRHWLDSWFNNWLPVGVIAWQAVLLVG